MSEVNTTNAGVTEIRATYKKGGEDQECAILYDFGGSVAVASEKFGEDVVYTNFVRASKVIAQAAMRRFIEQGKTDEEVAEAMAAWKPGVAFERTVDPVAALMSKFGRMTPEEQAKLLADLQAKRA